MKIKKGDPVRVRLSTGEVVNAKYLSPAYYDKCHFVKWGGLLLVAIGGELRIRKINSGVACRFVGPTPIINLNNRGEK